MADKKLTLQMIIATVLVAVGVVLLFLGFFAVPVGEISSSVLTAFGEVGTFAGALLGIDYTYKFRMYKIDRRYEDKMKELEEDEEE